MLLVHGLGTDLHLHRWFSKSDSFIDLIQCARRANHADRRAAQNCTGGYGSGRGQRDEVGMAGRSRRCGASASSWVHADSGDWERRTRETKKAREGERIQRIAPCGNRNFSQPSVVIGMGNEGMGAMAEVFSVREEIIIRVFIG